MNKCSCGARDKEKCINESSHGYGKMCMKASVVEEPLIVGTFKWACSEGSRYYVQCKNDLPEEVVDNEKELMTVAQHKRIIEALVSSK